MTILVAGGDSFVWGSELSDCPHSGPNGYSHNTYSAILAKSADMEYVCAAYPGSANNAITRMAINKCQKYDDVFLLVSWTYAQRAEFLIDNRWTSINSWHTTASEFSQSYFRYVGDSEYYEIYSALKEILFLQQYCQVHKVPYMFMAADNYFYQHDNYYRSRDTYIDDLYHQIDWGNWFWFSPGKEPHETTVPRGFYQWALENKYKVGITHPLEEAHTDAAILIKEKFDELVKKSL